MALTSGSSIGPYEVVAPIGAGGMGEVYRARDARLNRDVAIKVLPELFTQDPDRLARFRREAQVLASLNHTNIGHIYGIEDQNSIHALILELVEGPTLADRIALGAIPLDEALPIARQIADALECAHEQGVIHRDLKPANIKVRPDGTVKVLDFGLAKAFDPSSASGSEVMNSPTLTARATQMGLIVGTAAYMAPEQARGRPVDRRADIWAFGVVLFEMLSGTRAFEGDDISITLASVLKDDVPWKALPPDLPASVLRVLRRCLEKEPKRRLSAIGDARLDLEDAAIAAGHEGTRTTAIREEPRWKRALPWSVATAAVAAALAATVLWAPWRPVPTIAPVRAEMALGVGGTLATNVAAPVVISPDGSRLVVVVTTGGRNLLFVRDLSTLAAVPLPGTEDGYGPFFSPDGRWIGFFAGGKLKKIAITGGAAVPLADALNGRGGSWGDDGTIVFQRASGPNAVLYQVAEGGGAEKPLGSLSDGEVSQRWPHVLPGAKAVLYSGNATPGAWDNANIMVRPLDGGPSRLLLRDGFHARYVRSGHILYVSHSVLYAVPFDLQRLEVRGDPVPVVDGVLTMTNTGGAHFSVSDTGVLVYLAGRSAGNEVPVHLVDQAGKLSVLRSQAADWFFPSFSPDGSKLAMTIGLGPDADIWIHEPERDLTKLTFGRFADFAPVWTPDGRRIAFASSTGASVPLNLYWQRSNGTGEPQLLVESPHQKIPFSFHPSGKYLAFTERSAAEHDIRILPLEGDDKAGWTPGTPSTFLGTPHIEAAPMFSPDGRWIAYMSNESGQIEVYVRPFPSGDGKWKISTATGIHPLWSTTGNELFYLETGPFSTIKSVRYAVDGDSFRAHQPTTWSPQPVNAHGTDRPYAVHPDGRRMAIIKAPEEHTGQPVDHAILVFNFFDELRRIASAK